MTPHTTDSEAAPPTYNIQPGDTQSSIAEAVYGDPLCFAAIAEANDITNDNPIFIGQSLVIPPDGCSPETPDGRPPSATSPPSHEQLYILQAGDTLIDVSEQVYGTPYCARAIADANGLDPTGADLRVGQELIVPASPGPCITATSMSDQ